MTTPQVQLERRAAQRFGLSLPISVRLADAQKEQHGFTQDLSARGIYFYTDFHLDQGAEVEITLVMPAEITLSDNMRVCCRGRVLRVDKLAVNSATNTPAPPGAKIGVAVHFEHYEYLPDNQATSRQSDKYLRVACLHRDWAEEESSHAATATLRKL